MPLRSIPAVVLATGLLCGAGDCATQLGMVARDSQTIAESKPGEPALPVEILDVPKIPQTTRVLRAATASAFERALDDARPGDTIELVAGTTYRGSFVLPAKTGDDYVYIRTSAYASLPPSGTRVGPADASKLARVESPSSSPALATAAGAHHYRVVGLELTVDPAVPLNYGVVALGDGSSAQTDADTVPHDLILDRCYVHGSPNQEVKRGVALNGARTSIVDSHISDCHMRGQDSQAVAGWNGPGPFKLVDNYLEGSAENILFGGADPAIADLVPSDVEIRFNTISKPTEWQPAGPSHWLVKNLLELKNARRVLVEGNRFENCWADGQVGFAIVLTPRNADGTAPWSTVEDVTIRNNLVQRTANGVNVLGTDTAHESGRLARVLIRNNVFDDVGDAAWGGQGILFQLLDGTESVRIDHNTGLQSGSVLVAEGVAHRNFAFTNNLAPHNRYGVFGGGAGVGNPALRRYFPGYVFTNNVLVGGRTDAYPPRNFFPPSFDAVGFVDRARGNYRLDKNSPFKRAALDGADVGCDIAALKTALRAEGDEE